MQPVAIVPASTRGLVREFVDVPYAIYAGHPHWVPPLRRDEHRRLSPAHNPFFEHADVELLLARRGDVITGRIASIDDRLHNDFHREAVTWFGFFEAADLETARALVAAVEQRARDRGSAIVRGPANPSLNESAGLLIDVFDEDPYILMPYNPPQYAGFLEAAGYTKAKDLLAWHIDLTVPVGARVAAVADRVARRHDVKVRTVDLREFDRDFQILLSIYRAAWSDNWGFVPPTDAEMRQLAVDLRPVIDPELVLFAEIGGGAVACAVAVPDLNQVLKRMRGRLLPFGILSFLRRSRIIDQARLLLLGVLPAAQRLGLYPLLIAEIHGRGVRRGIRRGELSWTLEDNVAINAGIEAAGGRRYKTYRLYEKAIG